MLDKKTSIETVKNFISDLKLLGYNPTQAWLFGSVVSGKTHEYSDIDLALWDSKFTGCGAIDVEKIVMLMLKYKLIELHSYPSNITEDEDPFIEVIKKTGEKIL